MNILLVGDSHTNILRVGDVTEVFYKTRPLTIKDFNEDDSWCWPELDLFLKQHSVVGNDTMILCTGEVDIRAHYWKHIIEYIAKGGTVQDYMQDKAHTLYNAIKRCISDYNLKQVTLWGPPPIPAFRAFDPPWPFVGSVSTRNILIHMFNKAFIKEIENDNSVRFATAFYHFIDQTTYIADPKVSHDGTHYAEEHTNLCWELISPTIIGQKLVKTGDIKDNQFMIESVKVKKTLSHHSWVLADDLKQKKPDARSATINGKEYHYTLVTNESDWPEEYHELCLVPVL
jgi:hypothetical protein